MIVAVGSAVGGVGVVGVSAIVRPLPVARRSGFQQPLDFRLIEAYLAVRQAYARNSPSPRQSGRPAGWVFEQSINVSRREQRSHDRKVRWFFNEKMLYMMGRWQW
jgi:hypothetical protein